MTVPHVTLRQATTRPLVVTVGTAIAGLLPGVALSTMTAFAAAIAAPLAAHLIAIPAMVIALGVGIAFNRIARRPFFEPGIAFCLKSILRWAVALLGLRIALGDVAALGWRAAAAVVAAMGVTAASGFLFARLFGQPPGFGALAGAGAAVCGASATLATSIVVPDYKGKSTDVAFVVVAVNALSTLAMVLYPVLCSALGFDPERTGVMLGATIHDVAQVVGAGYSVSETVGNTAVVVKLFRVFLLLPLVLVIGWWFVRKNVVDKAARIPIPVFALVFVGLCVLNSIAPSIAALAPLYAQIKTSLIEVSNWGLLTAIGALGLGTSLPAITAIGWRHVATITGTTLVILIATTGGLMIIL